MSRVRVRVPRQPLEASSLPDPVIEAPHADAEPLDFAALFPGAAPPLRVEIEVGTGKGQFLLAQALARPAVQFLGIERSGACVRYVRHHALRLLAANVRLIRGDATPILARHVPPGSVAAVHVLFPDPWPKRRHSRRRLLNRGFLAAVARALQPGGVLNIATDQDDYGALIEQESAAVPALEPLPHFLLGAGNARTTGFGSRYTGERLEFFMRSWRRR